MTIKCIPTGQLEANCYIVADEETNIALIIDPGDEPDRILEAAQGLDVQYIVLTHGHFDHLGAVPEIKEHTGAKVAIHEDEIETYKSVAAQGAFWGFKMPEMPAPDMLLNEGDEIEIGEVTFTVIHTPGHSPGSMCLYTKGVVITGDTLFANSVGRTDFPGGSMPKLKTSFRKLMALPDDTGVLPGHGPGTTIKRERTENFFSFEV